MAVSILAWQVLSQVAALCKSLEFCGAKISDAVPRETAPRSILSIIIIIKRSNHFWYLLNTRVREGEDISIGLK
jgi:hypothetical protein